MKKIFGCFIVSLLFIGCGKQIPKDIIQPQEMEKVLYDYHLVTGMTLNESTIAREAYRNYVFQKHGITKAEFDSSMVWYTRKSSELAEIYKNISERFKREEEYINLLIGDKAVDERITEAGDSVDIWTNAPIYWLTDTPLSNQLRFEIKPDSNFHPKDALVWNAYYTLLSSGKATMGLNLVFDNDSVLGKTITVTESGPQMLELRPDSAYQLKSVNGFIYVYPDSTQVPSILVNDISLMRYHAENDTIKQDSVKVAP